MRRLAVAGVAVIACLSVGLAAGWWWLSLDFSRSGPLIEDRVVVVPKGEGIVAIAQRLERAGIVRSARFFILEARLFGSDRPLLAGEYAVPGAAGVKDILLLLQEGRVVIHRLTVPEGLTVSETLAIIRAAEPLEGDLPSSSPPEGSLLPETYNYVRGDERADMVRRMSRAMQESVQAIWDKRAPTLPLTSPESLVILASIIEKETAIDAERPRVAAVYLNRLRKRMRLQADPTVAYGLGLHGAGAGVTLRALTKADLTKPTPFNTYLIDGLPPTPIANPGKASLMAASHPAVSDDLYFVADGSGGHAFSRTYEEHTRNVEIWRKRRDTKPSP